MDVLSLCSNRMRGDVESPCISTVEYIQYLIEIHGSSRISTPPRFENFLGQVLPMNKRAPIMRFHLKEHENEYKQLDT